MSVPTIDFVAFHLGSKVEQAQLASRINNELRKNGAVRLINHGIPAEMICECYRWRIIFQTTHGGGWSYFGSEKTLKLNMMDKDGQVPQDLEDEKEHFDFCRAEDAQFPSKWPSESSVPGFRKFMEIFLNTCHDVGMDIMQSLEQGLDLSKGELVNRFSTKVDEVRLNYYSPLPTEKLSDGKHQRAWPHTELGMLTLLFQDKAGGLEVEDRSNPGSFIPIHRESSGEMSVYVSDTLEHLTNSYLRAGVHQVVAPTGTDEKASGFLPECYSIACFLEADRETSVGPLKAFITAGRPRVYEDMATLVLHRKRVGQLYTDA